MESEGSLPCSEEPSRLKPFLPFCNKIIFYGLDLLVPYPNPKLEANPSAVHDCLFIIFTDTLHIWRKQLLILLWSLQKIICSEYNPVLTMSLWKRNSLIYDLPGNYHFKNDRWETEFKGQVIGINISSFPCLLKQDLPLVWTLTRYSEQLVALETCFVSYLNLKLQDC
jgi:hypothetical protein